MKRGWRRYASFEDLCEPLLPRDERWAVAAFEGVGSVLALVQAVAGEAAVARCVSLLPGAEEVLVHRGVPHSRGVLVMVAMPDGDVWACRGAWPEGWIPT